MTDAVPARVPLGAATLVRKWYLDVNTGTDAVPVWVPVCGITNFQPPLTPTNQDATDFDSEGFKANVVTALAWAVNITVSRKQTTADPTAYDPGQEVLRLAANTLGGSNLVPIRFYEMMPGGPRVEAYSGSVTVSWNPAGGAEDALDSVPVVLTGYGKRNQITHPDAAGS